MVNITHCGKSHLGFESDEFSSHWVGVMKIESSDQILLNGFSKNVLSPIKQFQRGTYHVYVLVTDQNIPSELVVFNGEIVGDGSWNHYDVIHVSRKTISVGNVIGQTIDEEESKQIVESSAYNTAVIDSSNIVVQSGYGNGKYDLYVYEETQRDKYLGFRVVFINEGDYYF